MEDNGENLCQDLGRNRVIPFKPKRDQHLISPHINIAESIFEIIRVKEMIGNLSKEALIVRSILFFSREIKM